MVAAPIARGRARLSPALLCVAGEAASLARQFPDAAETGTGVICETRALPGAVIPAKAGIYSASHWKCAADGLDSRFRGNDQCLGRAPNPNGTTTTLPPGLTGADGWFKLAVASFRPGSS
jgi:hypothetical protein